MATIRRIVCPTDFSPTSAKAVELAMDMARSFGADLLLVHVVPDITQPFRSFGMATAFPQLREELLARAADSLRTLATKGTGITVRTKVLDGEVHTQVLDCAKREGADLVVIGTHGHTGLKHALLGSTAERVVRLAECPVLTVRG